MFVISIITRLYNPLVGLIKSPLPLHGVESRQSSASVGGKRCTEQQLVHYYKQLACIVAYYIVHDHAYCISELQYYWTVCCIIINRTMYSLMTWDLLNCHKANKLWILWLTAVCYSKFPRALRVRSYDWIFIGFIEVNCFLTAVTWCNATTECFQLQPIKEVIRRFIS